MRCQAGQVLSPVGRVNNCWRILYYDLAEVCHYRSNGGNNNSFRHCGALDQVSAKASSACVLHVLSFLLIAPRCGVVMLSIIDRPANIQMRLIHTVNLVTQPQ